MLFRMARIWFWILVLIAAVFCGCSPQKRLARKIADADCVILVQRHSGRPAVAISIQGDEVHQLAGDISAARQTGEELSPENDFAELEFLKGTKLLGFLRCSPNRYWIEGKGYSGETGALFDTRDRGPIQFRLPVGFRGFIHITRNVTNGSAIAVKNGAYQLDVPADGVVAVSNPGLLYSWAETAFFADGTEIPIQADSQSGGIVSPEKEMLRALGTFSTNGLTFATFYVGTQSDLDLDRQFAALVPRPFGLAYEPVHWWTRVGIVRSPFLTILLVCLGLICYRKLATRRRREKEFPVGSHDASLDLSLVAKRIKGPRRRWPSPRPFFFRKARLKAARQTVSQSQFLCRVRSDTADPSRIGRPSDDSIQ